VPGSCCVTILVSGGDVDDACCNVTVVTYKSTDCNNMAVSLGVMLLLLLLLLRFHNDAVESIGSFWEWVDD